VRTDDLISIAQAQQAVLGATTAPLPAEEIPVTEGLDRVLAADLAVARDVPSFRSSAMDGYAIVAGAAGRRLTLAGEASAGHPAVHPLAGADHAIRISTGAMVPDGADAVIRQEDTEGQDGSIITTAASRPGDNIRQPGEDLAAGTLILLRGTRLGAHELGVAVAAGAGALTVTRRPHVAVLCTGSELRAPGAELGPGQIHNSNLVSLAAMSTRAGALPILTQTVPDDGPGTSHAIARGLEQADVVVISGGVSVGPHDHVRPALDALGVTQKFWGVRLQPGKPTWFGTRGDRLVFGLPGNPVSAVVTFNLFVYPALSALLGAILSTGKDGSARLTVQIDKNPGREQAIRVRLRHGDGQLLADPTGPQGSHISSSLIGADALALIPQGTGRLKAGDPVRLIDLLR
jgi:molybdopterin molybdotransferase